MCSGGFQFVCSPANDKVTHNTHSTTNAHGSQFFFLFFLRVVRWWLGGISCCRFAGFLVCGRDPRPLVSFSFPSLFASFFSRVAHLFLNPSDRPHIHNHRARFARGISRGHPINPSPLRRWLSIVTDINNPLRLCLIIHMLGPSSSSIFESTTPSYAAQFQPSHFPIWFKLIPVPSCEALRHVTHSMWLTAAM